MVPLFKFPTRSLVPFDLPDVPLLCSCMGQTEADTAPRLKLDMDCAERSPRGGWERSEKAGRAHSSFPYSKKPVTGE